MIPRPTSGSPKIALSSAIRKSTAHGCRERVQLVRALQREDGDALLLPGADELATHKGILAD
jgi:hypothetical protein